MDKIKPTYVVCVNTKIRVVLFKHLPNEQRDLFTKWNAGATTCIMEGAYYHDYERWYDAWSQGKEAIQDD